MSKVVFLATMAVAGLLSTGSWAHNERYYGYEDPAYDASASYEDPYDGPSYGYRPSYDYRPSYGYRASSGYRSSYDYRPAYGYRSRDCPSYGYGPSYGYRPSYSYPLRSTGYGYRPRYDRSYCGS